MTEIGVRQLMPDDEGELCIRLRSAQYAGRNHDAIIGRESIDAGIDLKLDGYGAGNDRNDCPHLIDTITPDQNLDRLFAIFPYVAADPSGRAVTRDRLIIESQKLVTGFDACGRTR